MATTAVGHPGSVNTMSKTEITAISVSPGVGVGKAWVVSDEKIQAGKPRRIDVDSIPSAVNDFEAARSRAIKTLSHIQAATAKELGIQDAAIYGAQIAVLQDPSALDEIQKGIREKLLTPVSAIHAVIKKFEGIFESMEGGDMKTWAADLRDPWQAVLRELLEEKTRHFMELEGSIVLIAGELLPSLPTRFPRERIAAIVCERGGRYSHGAVVARSFGIPTVTGADQATSIVEAGSLCVVYADEGQVRVGATTDEVDAAERLSAERESVRAEFEERAKEPGCVGADHPLRISVNIESPRDLDLFSKDIVEGVGLFRTEFAYMERANFPTAQEQEDLYRGILKHFGDAPVVFRTLDVGNDKQLRYFQMPQENNPAMGWRGLRMSLQWPDILLMQIQALVKAREYGDVRMLLPMVTNVEEIRQVKRLIEQVAGRADALPLGAMIEVPSAAMALKDIMDEVDFLSVGTNDLAQYLFAVDRDNPWVADLYQPYHPAHLRVLRFIGNTCRMAGKPISVCGEMSGQRAGALFLAGAGFDQLSMAPPFVPEIKAILREVSIQELRVLARKAAACATNLEAFRLLEDAAEIAWQSALKRSGKESGKT